MHHQIMKNDFHVQVYAIMLQLQKFLSPSKQKISKI